jgi:hypothetical protein
MLEEELDQQGTKEEMGFQLAAEDRHCRGGSYVRRFVDLFFLLC